MQAVNKWMMALAFWERSITKRMFAEWRGMVERRESQVELAKRVCETKMCEKCLHAWRKFVKNEHAVEV